MEWATTLSQRHSDTVEAAGCLSAAECPDKGWILGCQYECIDNYRVL